MMLSDRFESFLSVHSSRLWTLARGAAVTALLVASAHAQVIPTTSYGYAPWRPCFTNIPGLTFGPNHEGRDVVWVGSYCGATCAGEGGVVPGQATAPGQSPIVTWPGGTILELDPVSGAQIAAHPYVPPATPWGIQGPTGLAYDPRDSIDQEDYLWVASYGDKRVYKVRVRDFVVVFQFALPKSPIGGLAFDATHDRLWLTMEDASVVVTGTQVYEYTRNGTLVATHLTPNYRKAGLECAFGRIFLVDFAAGRIEVRLVDDPATTTIDEFATIVGAHDLPHAEQSLTTSSWGDLAIDPETGDGFWSARPHDDFYKVHLIDDGEQRQSFCFGDGSGAACPCWDTGQVGAGCAHSPIPVNLTDPRSRVGAFLLASGSNSVAANDLRLSCYGLLPASFCVFTQGTGWLNGGLGLHASTTDGLSCVGGTLLRVGLVGPLGGHASVSNVAVAGGIPPVGGTRYYQVSYRNQAAFCQSATLNTSNGMRIEWRP